MDGILVVNKEANMTSHDVVFKLRKILNTKKIGHSGTLDPNATGVLIVLVGKACKILPYIEDIDKEYVSTLKLGQKTLSDDIWDEVIEEKKITPIENLDLVLQSFKGKIKQYPPMISSIKINGKKLYEYARNNIPVERPLRDVEIFDIELLDAEEMKFRVHCSSGTYIRSLCVDIAEKTNNLGCMSSLERTKVGRFSIEEAFTLEDIKNGNYKLYSINDMLSHMKQVAYKPIQDIYHGKRIQVNENEKYISITDQNEVIAIYEKEENRNTYRCARGLW